ncbi:hypothetical protein A2W15_02605 [Candidatus Woesebacteria bacterium RBG_16_41_13]|nr:MAG: hypothetical protein A2W15_02605 [Candidatus Woesebacteria bacterium RBG_16_41_13]
MEAQNTVIALAVAGVITPWLVEIIKRFIGDPTGKKALATTMVISVLIAGGVLWYQGALNFADPASIFGSAAMVLGIASTVYQFVQKAVVVPVDKLMTGLIK